jgi:formylmethanofuran dehydrogenase subunit D
MPETFILIPGRTAKQGAGISEGKFEKTYQYEINHLQVSPQDMERLGIEVGDRVRLTGEHGQVEVDVIASKGDELPPGLLFIPYGDISSRLMGAETHGSGMPTSKGMDVEMELINKPA